jgi:hypothetical protein
MRNRPLTEISRRAGELAVVWFETVIPKEPPEYSDVAEEDDLASEAAV